MYKLTTQEAMELIDLLKQICENQNIVLPNHGERTIFNVKAINNQKKFIVNINHDNINENKYSFQARTFENNIPLLRLDVNPNGVHENSDRSKIYGTHLHIYSEEYGIRNAIEFNINNPNLYDYCIAFFEKFNIIERNCDIIYQEELNDGGENDE